MPLLCLSSVAETSNCGSLPQLWVVVRDVGAVAANAACQLRSCKPGPPEAYQSRAGPSASVSSGIAPSRLMRSRPLGVRDHVPRGKDLSTKSCPSSR